MLNHRLHRYDSCRSSINPQPNHLCPPCNLWLKLFIIPMGSLCFPLSRERLAARWCIIKLKMVVLRCDFLGICNLLYDISSIGDRKLVLGVTAIGEIPAGRIIRSQLVLQKTFEFEPIFHPIGPGGNGLFRATESVAVPSFTVDMHLG